MAGCGAAHWRLERRLRLDRQQRLRMERSATISARAYCHLVGAVANLLGVCYLSQADVLVAHTLLQQDS